MSKKYENKLVPEFRFPDFIKDGEWQSNRLGNVYSFITTNSLSRDDLNYVKGEVKNIHYGDIHTKFPTLFDITKEKVPYINESIPLDKFKRENYCKEGDLIFADASEDLKDVGKSIELVNLNNEKLLSGLHTLLARQINSEFAIGFGGYLFLNDRIRKQIQRESQGAKVLGISATRLSNIHIFYPKERKEQQKIAACLSSLDEVIKAESQKLDILKDHKKGLLQNLLPQEGETVPKYRFEEFEDSEEWELKALGELVDVLMCKRIFAEETNENSGVPFFKIGTLGGKPDAFISRELFEEYKLKYNYPRKGEVLITCSGTVGKCLIYDGQDAYYQDSNIVWLDNEKLQVSNELLFHLLSNVNWSILNSTTITRIYGSDLRGLKIQYPKVKEEQDMVARCLSSCDQIIIEQSKKVEELKCHKKGLLQGLFP